MIKLFKKPESLFFYAFFDRYGPWFLYISGPKQKVKKNLIHIYQVRDGKRDEQTGKNQKFYQTTTLQAGPINQADNDSFWRD